MRFEKIALGLVFMAVFGSTLPAAAQTSDHKLVESGRLTFGTAATLPPFEYQKDNKLVGFNIELVEAISKKLELQPQPVNMEFRGLIPALQGRRIDVIMNAMAITPERAEQVDFIPYLKIGSEIVVAKGDAGKINSREDLCGRSVGVTLGGLQERYAREDARRCEASGKPTITVLTFPTAQDSAIALRQGRTDALYDTTPGAIQKVTELPDVFAIAGKTFEIITIGFGVKKGEPAWKERVASSFKAVSDDGTYAKLIAKYRLPETADIFK